MRDATSKRAATVTGHYKGCARFPYTDRAIMRREFHCTCGVEPGAPGFGDLLRLIWTFLTGWRHA